MRAPIAWCSALAPLVASRMCATCASTSSRCVGSDTNIAETLFALSMSAVSSLRTETGHAASNGRSGKASRRCRYRRNAPVAVASTMSFTVQPNAFFIDFTSSRETDANATRRCGVNGAFHGVRGVLNGVPPEGRLESRRTRVNPTAPRSRFGIANASAIGSGRRSREMIACRTSSKSDGLCSGFQSSFAGDASTGSGSRSRMLVARLEPDTPSIVAWCIRARTATAPCSTPSMTQNSQRGRERSKGRPAMSPTMSASCSVLPGDSTAMWRTW